jgi:RNA polymerase sigma-70 factor (ECF subfamily)
LAAVAPVARATQVEPLEGSLAARPAQDLFEHHAARILKYCRWQLRNREDAEDAVQTTFLYAFRALSRGVVPANEGAWLQAIAKNVCLTGRKAGRRRDGFEVACDPHVLADAVPGQERRSDVLMGLGEALGGLTEQQRQAILLREWKGLSYQEIADEMGLSLPAVEALIFRARRAVAARLEGESAPKRGALASFLDFGSLLGGLKPLLSGVSALKLTAGVIAVAGAVAIAGTPLSDRDTAKPGNRPATGPAPTLPAAGARSGPEERVHAARAPEGKAASTRGSSAPAGGRDGAVRPNHSPTAGAPAGAVAGGNAELPALPGTEAPNLPGVSTETLPGVSAPGLPEIQLPALPGLSVPQVSVPQVSVPQVSVPQVSVPELSLPAPLPAAPSLPAVQLPGVGLSPP